jgi:hypothetical protein
MIAMMIGLSLLLLLGCGNVNGEQGSYPDSKDAKNRQDSSSEMTTRNASRVGPPPEDLPGLCGENGRQHRGLH